MQFVFGLILLWLLLRRRPKSKSVVQQPSEMEILGAETALGAIHRLETYRRLIREFLIAQGYDSEVVDHYLDVIEDRADSESEQNR